MLPSVISRQIQEGVRSFLGQMFPVTTPYFQGMMEGMRKGACDYFRGPWYELHLPFETEVEGRGLPFKKVKFPYTPHRHQAQAFRRLAGDERLSTLVATGTGSGKTECFMYPLLDYCATHREPGIKAVVIYPMNALANDQAKRFARAVHDARKADASVPELRVGLYLGHGLHEGGTGSHTMGKDHVIDDRYSLQKNPPDILLTNYKMLDYLLLRKKDSGLWAQNTPTTLAYVVVDELHTFDGAQATDLACLVRRLKYRLGMKPGKLCCVGTSATLGDGDDDSRSRLTGYARTVFGEPDGFKDAGCIVRESALPPEVFLKGRESTYFRVPSAPELLDLPMRKDETPGQWLERQFALWFGDAPLPADMHEPKGSVALGELLLQHRFLVELLGVYQQGGALPMEEANLKRGLARVSPDLENGELFRNVLDSFLSLCAVALYTHPRTGQVLRSFLRMHVHLWMRELSNMRGQVFPWAKRNEARLVFAADAKQGDPLALPLVHCRNCGSLAWGALTNLGTGAYSTDGSAFAREFISGSTSQVRLLMPVEPGHVLREGSFRHAFCAKCSRMTLFSGPELPKCHHCHSDENMVEVEELSVEGMKEKKACPCCGATNSIFMLGSQAAGLNSAAISILLASPANTEPKMLAFSDNVQDASHRAGFFNSRTYSHLLRTELYRRLSARNLPDLAALWEDTVQNEDAIRTPEEFVAAFMPQDKTWLEDWRHFEEKGELLKREGGADLCSLVRRRMAWEFYTELTWRSHYGRTLERTGAYMLTISPERIAEASEDLAGYVEGKLASSFRLGTPDIARWVIGLLRYLRTNGAVLLPLLQGYAVDGNAYVLSDKGGRDTWMPRQSDHVRPRFLTTEIRGDFLSCGSSSGGRPCWLEDWTMRVFDGRLGNKRQTEPFIVTALERLVAVGLLVHPAPGGKENSERWGIPPAELKIEPEVAGLRCDCCGMLISIGSCLQPMAAGMPCMKTGCRGHLTPCEPNTDGQGLYTMGHERRLRAADHSSLLDKQEREELEKRFIAQDTPVAPNMLSCTPTLEMGVDIGDLESVLLCSVPPRTANYRQRIGRAGRARGNAFSLTTANNKSNNLYFYHAPQNMIAGDVEVPGVYLKATSILERQLLAFYLDNWVQLGNDLPRKVRDLLAHLDDSSSFPQLFYNYAERNGDRLYVEFLTLFNDDFPELGDYKYVRKSIREKADQMCDRLATHFLSLRAERDSYATKRDDCRKVRQKLKAMEAERGLSEAENKELEDVTRQYAALRSVIANLESRDMLEFLTDEGLLPNYAFPESGVTLDSILIKSKGEDKKSEPVSETYVRAGASAITELAVGNYFYVKGLKLRVNQVDLSPQGDNEPAVQDWRFCPDCHYIARKDLLQDDGRCPKCHAVWSDQSQVRPMVRMKRVVATSSLKKALSLDTEDERNVVTYQKYMVPEVLSTEPSKTWLMESARSVFAYQYVGLVQFREMNLGCYDSNAPKLRTDSKELQVPGFCICSGCGKLLTPKSSIKDHDWGCPNRKKPGSAPAIDGLLLYRELKSEALRISLPSSTHPSDAVREAFMSALMLGLRQHFQGDTAHLHFCDDHLHIKGEDGATAADLDCLMLYDSVPGGTGYLKQLGVDGESLLTVLRKALDAMLACPCAADDEADGCHLCVLGHRTKPNATPSRRLAIELLAGILEGGSPKEIKSMEDIPMNPLLGSELERKFMARLCQDERFRVEPFFRNKPCYSISYATENSGPATTLWILEPQAVVKDLPEGIKTVPDFVLHPSREGFSQKIAVYLDGAEFHASTSNNRFADDLLKREHLRKLGYLVWTMTWDDVAGDPEKQGCKALPGINPWQQFIELLTHGSEALHPAWHDAACQCAFTQCGAEPELRLLPELLEFRGYLETGAPDSPVWSEVDEDAANAVPAAVLDGRLWRYVSQVLDPEADEPKLLCRISFDSSLADDSPEYREEWHAFWMKYNLFQFVDDFYATTPLLGSEAGYRYETAAKQGPPDWLEDASLDLLEFFATLPDLPQGELYEEMADADGQVVAQALVVWKDRHVAIVDEWEAPAWSHLEKQGWDILVWNEENTAGLAGQVRTIFNL